MTILYTYRRVYRETWSAKLLNSHSIVVCVLWHSFLFSMSREWLCFESSKTLNFRQNIVLIVSKFHLNHGNTYLEFVDNNWIYIRNGVWLNFGFLNEFSTTQLTTERLKEKWRPISFWYHSTALRRNWMMIYSGDEIG